MSAAGPLRTLLVISLAAAALCPRARASAWEADPSATRIEFSVRNLSIANVDGHFRLTSGRVMLVDEDPSRSTVEAVIDATSVDTGEPKRDRHLRSADFLDVDHHPSITFRSTRIEQVGAGHWKVAGALTILDATRPVVLDVQGGTVHGNPCGRTRVRHDRPQGLRDDLHRLRGGEGGHHHHRRGRPPGRRRRAGDVTDASAWRNTMTRFVTIVVPLLLSLGTARAACTDAAAVAATRAAAEVQCPCAAASGHKAYIRCVAQVAKAAAQSGSLPKQCRASVVGVRQEIDLRQGGVHHSASGRPPRAATTCSVKPSAAKCTAPKGERGVRGHPAKLL